MFKDKPFKCYRCFKSFDTKAQRNNHKNKDHRLPHTEAVREKRIPKKR